MLAAHLMERSDDRALEQAPHALDTVGVDIAYDPLLDRVVDRFVACIVIGDPQVRLEFVGIDGFGFVLDGAGDEVMEGALRYVWDAFEANPTLALDGAGDDGLVARVAAPLALYFAADERFIHLDNPNQRRATQRVVTHGLADTVTEIPRRAEGNAERAPHLAGRYAFFGLAHQVDGEEPLSERQVGIVHDGTARYGELVAA